MVKLPNFLFAVGLDLYVYYFIPFLSIKPLLLVITSQVVETGDDDNENPRTKKKSRMILENRTIFQDRLP
jgi:hypothetical protein